MPPLFATDEFWMLTVATAMGDVEAAGNGAAGLLDEGMGLAWALAAALARGDGTGVVAGEADAVGDWDIPGDDGVVPVPTDPARAAVPEELVVPPGWGGGMGCSDTDGVATAAGLLELGLPVVPEPVAPAELGGLLALAPLERLAPPPPDEPPPLVGAPVPAALAEVPLAPEVFPFALPPGAELVPAVPADEPPAPPAEPLPDTELPLELGVLPESAHAGVVGRISAASAITSRAEP